MKFHRWILLYCFVTVACNQQKDKNELVLGQAADVHNEMMGSARALEERLELLAKDSLNTALTDSVTAWKALLEAWENDVVEVPGNEAPHAHGEDEHSHDHKSVEVTPEQMLVIQQELRNRLDRISQRIGSISAQQ